MIREAQSLLDEPALAVLRAQAAAHAGPFIDPVVFRQAGIVLAGVDAGWLSRVAGRRVGWWGDLDNREMWLAVRAAEADAVYLKALAGRRADAARAESRKRAEDAVAAHRAKRDGWESLRVRLPVPVVVCHNWTARHLDGYEQGADHIVILAALDVGRFHREAGQPLCWTPSRAHELRHVGANVGDEKRIPDCKACMRRAGKLAEAT